MLIGENVMINNYLHINNGEISYHDNAFMGISTIPTEKLSEFCLEKAYGWRNSDLGNYDEYTKEQREEMAKRWENVKDLPDGEYEYYFNFEDKFELFKKHVQEFAEKMNISYELTILNQ